MCMMQCARNKHLVLSGHFVLARLSIFILITPGNTLYHVYVSCTVAVEFQSKRQDTSGPKEQYSCEVPQTHN